VEEVMENLENPVFGKTSFRGPIGSIKCECKSSQKIQTEIRQSMFLKRNISSPFFAAEKVISQPQRDTL